MDSISWLSSNERNITLSKIKEFALQMEENEGMELLVYWTAEGKVVLEAGENALVMHRAEAEACLLYTSPSPRDS